MELSKQQRPAPTLDDKVGCAIFVMAWGAERTGAWTRDRLMWPFADYTDDDVRRAAAKVMTSVCTGALAAMPLEARQKIWTDQAEYLSFAVGDGSPGEKTPSQAVR